MEFISRIEPDAMKSGNGFKFKVNIDSTFFHFDLVNIRIHSLKVMYIDTLSPYFTLVRLEEIIFFSNSFGS
jgi:hypothetical protein